MRRVKTVAALLTISTLTLVGFQNCGGKGVGESAESSSAAQTQNPQTTNSSVSTCSFNSQTLANGISVTAYQSATVPAGQTCQSQTRTCNNGQLSGSYTFAACVQALCSPGTYSFLRITGQSGTIYTSDLTMFPSTGIPNYFLATLVVVVPAVQSDGSFTATVAWMGGDVPVTATGTCLNGAFSVNAPNVDQVASTLSASGSFGLSTNYTVNWITGSASTAGLYSGSGTQVSVTIPGYNMSNVQFIGVTGLPFGF